MTAKARLKLVPGGPKSSPPKPLRIVIGDDDRDNANMLALVFQDDGHEVMVALRGDETLAMCRLLAPDVVIADLNMPGMSGYAVARELRDRYGNSSPLLIAISGVWTTPGDRLLGQAAGFDHYLVKPVVPTELFRVIERERGNSAAETS